LTKLKHICILTTHFRVGDRNNHPSAANKAYRNSEKLQATSIHIIINHDPVQTHNVHLHVFHSKSGSSLQKNLYRVLEKAEYTARRCCNRSLQQFRVVAPGSHFTYSPGQIFPGQTPWTIPPPFTHGVGHFPLPPPPSADPQYKAINVCKIDSGKKYRLVPISNFEDMVRVRVGYCIVCIHQYRIPTSAFTFHIS